MTTPDERTEAIRKAELAADMAVAFYKQLAKTNLKYLDKEYAAQLTAAWLQAGMPAFGPKQRDE